MLRRLGVWLAVLGLCSCSSSDGSFYGGGSGYGGGSDGTDGSPPPFSSDAGAFSDVGAPNGPGDATQSDAGSAPEPEEEESVIEERVAREPDDRVKTNPFVMVSSNPLSTFAADVDTASYDIFRKEVAAGRLPMPSTVRLEEYVNAFGYGYTPPPVGEGIPFELYLDGAPSPFTTGANLVRVGIKGFEWTQLEKKPVNVVFLIDVSGSMKPVDRLPLAQKVLTETVKALSPTDTISIVTYSGTTQVALPPTPVSQKLTITYTINALKAFGSTAGGAGLILAYEQAELAFVEDGVNHVVLCTDGDFNVGTTSTEALVALIADKRQSGVTLTVLGFGDQLNDLMMEMITNVGNGVYAVIADAADAVEYAWDTLLPSMHFVAKDMKLQVAFNPNHVLAYRLLGYELNDIPDDLFLDDTIDAGEVGANHTVTALYEVIPLGGAIPDAAGAPPVVEGEPYSGEPLDVFRDEWLRVNVRWKPPGATASDPADQLGEGFTADDLSESFESADPDLRWAGAMVAFAEVLKGSPYANPEALHVVHSVVAQDQDGRTDRAQFASLFYQALSLLYAVP